MENRSVERFEATLRRQLDLIDGAADVLANSGKTEAASLVRAVGESGEAVIRRGRSMDKEAVKDAVCALRLVAEGAALGGDDPIPVTEAIMEIQSRFLEEGEAPIKMRTSPGQEARPLTKEYWT